MLECIKGGWVGGDGKRGEEEDNVKKASLFSKEDFVSSEDTDFPDEFLCLYAKKSGHLTIYPRYQLGGGGRVNPCHVNGIGPSSERIW